MSKFRDLVPVSRLVEIYGRGGFETSGSALCGWIEAVATEVWPVVARIEQRALASYLVQTDGSELKVLDRDDPEGVREETMRCLVGDRSYCVFRYARDGTGQEGPCECLQGREGYVLADASNIFDRLYNRKKAQGS